MAVKNRAAYGSVPSMTTIAFETMEDAVWPGNAPRAGRPSNPEHDALAKRLTDGAVLRLTPHAKISTRAVAGGGRAALLLAIMPVSRHRLGHAVFGYFHVTRAGVHQRGADATTAPIRTLPRIGLRSQYRHAAE